jgi:hypothetical protein
MMPLTSDWVTVNAAAKLIGLNVYEVEALAYYGVLKSRCLDLCHRSVSERSVTAFKSASELATPSGEDLAEHAEKPSWTPWSSADDPEGRDEQADFDDTPTTRETSSERVH